jgi:hypothetical protein
MTTTTSTTGGDTTTQNPQKARPHRRRQRKKSLSNSTKTPKNFTPHYVVHDYVDHGAVDRLVFEAAEATTTTSRRGVEIPFPLRLHQLLDDAEGSETTDSFAHIISWQPHGRCFVIHQPQLFVTQVLPRYVQCT